MAQWIPAFQLNAEGFNTENQPHLSAIGEGLVNLLMHTEYFSVMKPRTSVFTDRIEFLNPGALLQSLDKIRAGDLSLPCNPITARLFRMVNLAENAGYGSDKMETGWEEYSHSKPIFEQGIDFTRVEFCFPIRGGQTVNLTDRQNKILLRIKEKP